MSEDIHPWRREAMPTFLVLFFLINALASSDQARKGARFVYGFLFLWLPGLTLAFIIVFSCLLPYDLLKGI